ncbi:MAG: hypothetical protein J0M31_14610, partial [Candidatus Accumulibacter sp.]|nr:hypothetical protein [Accumulibacter sp.]
MHALAQPPTLLELIVGAAAIQLVRVAAPQHPGDRGARLLLGQHRQVEQGVKGRVAAAGHQHALAGVARALGPEHIGDAIEDLAGQRRFAQRRTPVCAKRVGLRVGARGVDHGLGREQLDAAGRLDLKRKRGLVAPGALHLVEALPGDRQHALPKAQVRRDLRQLG